MNTDVINETIDAWTREPDAARGKPTVKARADQAQAVIDAGPFTWRSDLPGPLGGSGQAPSPTALLLSALAGCAVVFIKDTLGPQLGVAVTGVEATVSCQADSRGLLGIDGVAPDLTDFALDVTVTSPDGDEAVAKIADVWQERCPIFLALLKPNDVAVQFSAA